MQGEGEGGDQRSPRESSLHYPEWAEIHLWETRSSVLRSGRNHTKHRAVRAAGISPVSRPDAGMNLLIYTTLG